MNITSFSPVLFQKQVMDEDKHSANGNVSSSNENQNNSTSNSSQQKSTIQFMKLSTLAKIPEKATPLAAGFDLCSATEAVISPLSRRLIRTDIAVKPPPNTYCKITGRSGWGRLAIDIFPGTIDNDYRGNLSVIVINSSPISKEQ